MSADVKSVPPWKLALLEKKRRHEEEDRHRRVEEEERVSRMPTWKRDILMKKQQQKNSLVFFAKPGETVTGKRDSPRHSENVQMETNTHTATTNDSPVSISNHIDLPSTPTQSTVSNSVPVVNNDVSVTDGYDDIGEEEGAGPSEEHIIPIQQNPWLRTDKKQRPHLTYKRYSTGSDHSDSINTYNSLPRNHSNSWQGPDEDNGEDEEIFNDDHEVAYGRGFVHKLLKKFKHLSARDDRLSPSGTSVGPKRSHSTENILEEVLGSGKGSPHHQSSSGVGIQDGQPTGIYASPTKARSMENLSGGKVVSSSLDAKVHGTDQRNCSQGSLDGSFSSASGSVPSPRGSTSYSDMPNHINLEEDGDISISDVVKGELPLPEEETSLQRHNSSEILNEDELPRANIVSSTRSIFETVSGTLTLNRGNKKRMAVEASKHGSGNESLRESSSSVPNGTVSHSELEMAKGHKHSGHTSSSEDTVGIQQVGRVLYSSSKGLEGEVGDGVSLQPGGMQQVNGKTGNDRNANYKSDNSVVAAESRTGSGAPAVTGQRANQTFLPTAGSNLAQDGHYRSSSGPTSNSIMQKNYQNNNRTSSQSSPSKATPEIISRDQDSHKDQVNFANSSKKRRAPLPPMPTTSSSSTTEEHVKHPNAKKSVSENTAEGPKNTDNRFKPNAEPKKPNLHLDFTSETRGQKQAPDSQSPSYRDRYFSSSGNTKESKVNRTSTVNHSPASDGDLINTDLSGSHRNGVLESNIAKAKPTSSSTNISPTRSSVSSKKEFAAPVPAPSSNQKALSITSTARPAQSSKPANGHAAALTLPIPKAGEGLVSSKVSGVKKGKRPNAAPSGSVGSLLIRPASNLVPGNTNTNTQYASIKKYNDVKTGVFEPAQAHPSYLEGLEDEYDVPVTNIDDVLDYVPVTNIDDITGNSHASPRFEQDADRERRILSSRYEFIGAGVSTSKNLLLKSRQQKVGQIFNLIYKPSHHDVYSMYSFLGSQEISQVVMYNCGDLHVKTVSVNYVRGYIILIATHKS